MTYENFKPEELQKLSKKELLKMAASYELKGEETTEFRKIIEQVAKELTDVEIKDLHDYLEEKVRMNKDEFPDDYDTNEKVKRMTLAKILIENTAKLN